jgi:hypothetical protein
MTSVENKYSERYSYLESIQQIGLEDITEGEFHNSNKLGQWNQDYGS